MERVRRFLIGAFFWSWLLAQMGLAATYYVSTTGSDAHACSTTDSAGTNKLTFHGGLACLAAGDTLDIHTGTYDDYMDHYRWAPGGGSWGTATTIRGHVGETVTIRPNIATYPSIYQVINLSRAESAYTIFDNLVLDGSLLGGACTSGGALGGGTGKTVVKITNWDGTANTAAHHIRFTNCEVKGGSGSGFQFLGLGAEYNETINCNVHNNGTIDAAGSGRHCHGYYDATGNNLIENNLIHDNAHMGVQIQGNTGSRPGNIVRGNKIYGNSHGIYSATMTDDLIYNNLIYDNLGTLNLGPVGVYFAGTVTNSHVYNNTITGQSAVGGKGIWFTASSVSGNTVRNNIIYNNTTAITDSGSSNTFSHNLTTNPSFVNAGTDDYHLQAGSSAINTGYGLSSVFTTDYDANSRPTHNGGVAPLLWDIGAFEFVAATPFITVLVPNGGESWTVGSTQTITWTSGTIAGGVDITADLDGNGSYETTIATNTTNDGTLDWVVAGSANASCKIDVKDHAAATHDSSDSVFALTAAAGGTLTKIISNNTTGTYPGDIPGVTDTHLYEAAPTTNYASALNFLIENYGSGTDKNGLIRFDGLSQIPATATVTSVTLGLRTYEYAGAGTTAVDIRRVLRDWTPSQVTWNVYSTGNSWTTAGGTGAGTDRVDTASGQIAAIGTASQFYSVTDNTTGDGLVDDVQKWVDGTNPNYGWNLQRNGAGDDGVYRRFVSTDNDSPSLKPYLSVTYTTTTNTITLVSPTAMTHVLPGMIIPIRWTAEGVSGNVSAKVCRGTDCSEVIAASYPVEAPDMSWTVAAGRSGNVTVKVCSLNEPTVCGESPVFRKGGLFF